MTQTGGLVILCAWLIFAGLLTVLAYLLLRHEQDPLQDLKRPGPDRDDDRDQGESLPADCVVTTPPRTRPKPAPRPVPAGAVRESGIRDLAV